MRSSRKNKIRKLLGVLDPESKPDLIAQGLEEEIRALDEKLSDIRDSSSSIADLNRGLRELKENVLSKLDSLPTNDLISDVKKKCLERIEETKESLGRLISEIESGLRDTNENLDAEIGEIRDTVERWRTDMLGRIANQGGGAMNRQILVNGVDVLTRYTDINLTGSLTATTNNGGRRVDIAFADTGAVWGSITGTLSDQTDLQTALDLKADAASYVPYSGATADLDLGAMDLLTTGRVFVRNDALGAAIDDSLGVMVKNGTTVPSGFSTEYSPPLTMVGYRRGFASAGEIKVAQYVKTDAFAGQQWAVAMSVDGGAYFELLNVDDNGDVTFTGELLGVSTMTVSGTLRGSFVYGNTTSGNAGTPTFSFFGDADTGMFRAGANILGFSTAGVERARIDATGNLVFNETGTDSDFRIESDGDANNFVSDGGTNRIGIGVLSPGSKLHIMSTTEQLRLGYDASNYMSVTTGSAGSTTFALTGTSPTFTFSQKTLFSGEVEIDGALNHDGTTVGLYAVTPVTRATTGIAEAAFVENAGGTAVNDDSTFGGYTLRQVVQALQNIGILT